MYALASPLFPFKRDEEKEAPSVEQPDLMPYFGLFILAKLSKTPEGLKVIKDLGKEFIKGLFDTLHALGQASSANYITAWANPIIVASILTRFGFVERKWYNGFAVGISALAGAKVTEGFVDEIARIFPFSARDTPDFPQQIVFSAREAGVEVPKEISWTEIAELMRARKLYRAPKKRGK